MRINIPRYDVQFSYAYNEATDKTTIHFVSKNGGLIAELFLDGDWTGPGRLDFEHADFEWIHVPGSAICGQFADPNVVQVATEGLVLLPTEAVK